MPSGGGESSAGRKDNMTYLEMRSSIIYALANFYSSRLRELEKRDKETFDDIIKGLEEEMEITLERFWED